MRGGGEGAELGRRGTGLSRTKSNGVTKFEIRGGRSLSGQRRVLREGD